MKWLVTGGAGFIGTNLVSRLHQGGDAVEVIDDLSRLGVTENANYLRDAFGTRMNAIDVSNSESLADFLQAHGPFDAVAHLAGQVSLLDSIANPVRDFEINAVGTLNVLESIRRYSPEATVIGMSSNKIYGDLRSVRIVERDDRYEAPDYPQGFAETLPLDFHGPYGCSKGTADQYLLDYHRIYGLRTVSLRMSSVYGPFQHPKADQGWLGFIVKEARNNRSVRLNGKGKQVRDLLHVSDLSGLFPLLARLPSEHTGNAYNVGGGPMQALSILQLFDRLTSDFQIRPQYTLGALRPSDQLVFVSDNTKVSSAVSWEPTITISEGLEGLLREKP